jgi:hypothetical protein
MKRMDFALKDLGELTYFLGIQMLREPSGMHLRRSKYIFDLLHKAKGAKPYISPCVSGSKLSSLDGDLIPNVYEYRQLIGALQYCTLTHPKIEYSVNQLCQHLHSPTFAHWIALKRVLCYFKDHVDHGLFYSRSSLSLQAYCNFDCASDPDDRRLITGFGVFFGPCLVSWHVLKSSLPCPNSLLKLNTRLWLW